MLVYLIDIIIMSILLSIMGNILSTAQNKSIILGIIGRGLDLTMHMTISHSKLESWIVYIRSFG